MVAPTAVSRFGRMVPDCRDQIKSQIFARRTSSNGKLWLNLCGDSERWRGSGSQRPPLAETAQWQTCFQENSASRAASSEPESNLVVILQNDDIMAWLAC